MSKHCAPVAAHRAGTVPASAPLRLAGLAVAVLTLAGAVAAAPEHPATGVPGGSGAAPQTAGAAAAQTGTGCLPNGSGYLRARIRGALRLDLDWHGGELECEGSARPGGRGIRLSFAGPLRRSERLRLIFGIGGTGEGRAGRALKTNVTVILEGERRLFSTGGDDKCTVDDLEQQPLGPPGGAERSYRVVARGFCFEPASDLIRNERIVISRFDFAGRIAFP
jgi:hypothetical protein